MRARRRAADAPTEACLLPCLGDGRGNEATRQCSLWRNCPSLELPCRERQHLQFRMSGKLVAVAMLRACLMPAEEGAIAYIRRLCTTPDMRDWEGPLTAVLLDYCAVFYGHCRSGGVGLPDILSVLTESRRRVEPIRAAKEEVWRDIDTKQPRLFVVKKDGTYLKTVFLQQCSLLRTLWVPPWFDTKGTAHEENVRSLLAAMRHA